jgi:hypothetical protein
VVRAGMRGGQRIWDSEGKKEEKNGEMNKMDFQIKIPLINLLSFSRIGTNGGHHIEKFI